MHTRPRPIRPPWRGAALVAALWLALPLAGCGVGGTTPTPSPTATPAPGSPALNGCPVQRATAAPPAADVVLTDTGAAQGATATTGSDFVARVTVPRGTVIEFRMAANYDWGLNAEPAAGVLRAEPPEGWYDAAHRACVWRYTAVGTGAARVDFAGGPVCPPGVACPAIARIAFFAVTVG